MYRCVNVKRFFLLLLGDAVAFLVLMVLVRTTVFGNAALTDPEGICLPVLMYHSVSDSQQGEYVISPKVVEQDLLYLREHGYETVFVADLIAYVYEGTALPEHPVLVTLDDGFYNNLSELLPILQRYDMKATVSVVGKFMDRQASQDAHHPAYSYLTYDEVRALSQSGNVEIGNHTYDLHGSHGRKGCAILPGESEAAYAALLRADVGRLQSQLTADAGVTPVVFAYPFGYLCRESIPALKGMGFLATLTCYERPNYITRDPDCLFGINRYNRPSGISTEAFMKKALKGTIQANETQTSERRSPGAAAPCPLWRMAGV